MMHAASQMLMEPYMRGNFRKYSVYSILIRDWGGGMRIKSRHYFGEGTIFTIRYCCGSDWDGHHNCWSRGPTFP